MITPALFVIFFVLFGWLAALSFFFVNYHLRTSRLSKEGKKDSLLQILNQLGKDSEENKSAIKAIEQEYDKLKKDGLSHIQKIGLVRFNPFKDTGGDQSFILALVDAENTGVVISSLHTRTGTRWYAKGVVKGKGVEYELSAEEERALKGAQFLSENPKL